MFLETAESSSWGKSYPKSDQTMNAIITSFYMNMRMNRVNHAMTSRHLWVWAARNRNWTYLNAVALHGQQISDAVMFTHTSL